MKAFRMEGPGVAGVEEVPDAVQKENEVLLHVRMVGMCGTDLNSYRGRNSMVTFPRVLGHEVAAEVIQGGVDLANGTAVTVLPYTIVPMADAAHLLAEWSANPARFTKILVQVS